jgi:hypothetical protein
MSDTQPNDKSFPRMPTKGRLFGQKPPLKPREVWSIRVRLQISGNKRDLALFNLAIDSKLRSCDLVTLRVADVSQAGGVRDRAVVIQQKTSRPVQFELTAGYLNPAVLKQKLFAHGRPATAQTPLY